MTEATEGVHGFRVEYRLGPMARTWTYVTELLVGLACLGLAIPLWRRPGVLRAVAASFAAAGLAAMAHAVIELVAQ
jgi:peptidoglycan/LPS O-acetylase OafA/YrhL